MARARKAANIEEVDARGGAQERHMTWSCFLAAGRSTPSRSVGDCARLDVVDIIELRARA